MKEKYIKFVESANIKVVPFKELKIGDSIIWSDWSRKIIKINEYNRTIDVTNPFDENISTLSFRTYYVIKNAKMKNFIPEKDNGECE